MRVCKCVCMCAGPCAWVSACVSVQALAYEYVRVVVHEGEREG